MILRRVWCGNAVVGGDAVDHRGGCGGHAPAVQAHYVGTVVEPGDLSPKESQYVLAALRDDALARCAQDGLFWLQFVRTRDEADPDHTVKPFPVELEYIRVLWSVLVDRQRIVVAKSRQMLISWLLCAFCDWRARFIPNQYIIWQSQKEEDANMMVSLAGGDKDTGYLGRMQFIERNLPSWLKQRVRTSEGTLVFPNGSRIEALPGGAHQVRGKVPSVIIEDEMAFQEEARGVYTAVAPLIQKATKFIAVSTPNGMVNCFAELYHGAALVTA